MKKFSIVLLVSLLFAMFLSCHQPESRIEGIYVNQHAGEYSVAWDTLVISKIPELKSSYKVENHTGFQRIRDSKKQSKEYKTKTWFADWDDKANAFTGSLYYPPIRLTPDGLLLKSTAYRKIR